MLLQGAEGGAEIGPAVGEARIQPGRLLVRGQRFVVTAQVVQDETAVRPGFGVLVVDRERAVATVQRLGETAKLVQGDAAIRPGRRRFGRNGQRRIEALHGIEMAMRAVQRQAEVVVELGVAGLDRDGLLVVAQRRFMVAGFALQLAERAVRGGEPRRDGQGALVVCRRLINAAGLVEHDALVVVRLEVARLHGDAAVVEGDRRRDVAGMGGGVAERERHGGEQLHHACFGRWRPSQRLEHRLRLDQPALAGQRKRMRGGRAGVVRARTGGRIGASHDSSSVSATS